jgi:hypothetical protein
VTANPSLFQVHTRVVLTDLGRQLGRSATLDDIPDQDLDQFRDQGFAWIWYLGIWQTGAASRAISASEPSLQAGFRAALPDLEPQDICGSPFAITAYTVHKDFGGDAALARLRERLRKRGMRLMLDFVANHTALDHPWVEAHPEFYVHGDEDQLRHEPGNYVQIKDKIFAHGRDPYFPGWTDTLQLNYAEPLLVAAMQQELQAIAAKCDGVRCDMAMLLLPEVFERTWGLKGGDFWPGAMRAARASYPEFLLIAEVYWGLEGALQQLGFDYTYDKALYDRLREGHAAPVRERFAVDVGYQKKSARFLENHDEPPAASVFSWEMHQPAAILTFLCPGLRFFHQGQREGRTRGFSIHLARGFVEPPQLAVEKFYDRLLACTRLDVVRNGQWRLLSCTPAWDNNWSWQCFVCFLWQEASELPLLVAVNYAPNASQCYTGIPLEELWGKTVRCEDRMSDAVYHSPCDGGRGLYLQMPAWGYQVLELAPASEKPRSEKPVIA